MGVFRLHSGPRESWAIFCQAVGAFGQDEERKPFDDPAFQRDSFIQNFAQMRNASRNVRRRSA